MLGGGAVQNTPALDKNAPHTSCYPQDAEFNFFTQVMTLFSAQLFHALSHGVLPFVGLLLRNKNPKPLSCQLKVPTNKQFLL